MALNSTKICNMTLTRIGEARITDITDTASETARLCNEHYADIRDELLAEGPKYGWKFAKTRQSVSVDDTEPDFEYDYRFQIPSTCLRIVSVQVDGVELTDWVREGDYILTNEESETVDMVYVQKITSEAKFPFWFARLLALTLASRIAFRVTQSEKIVQGVDAELLEVTDWAIAQDNRQNYLKDEGVNTLQDAGRS